MATRAEKILAEIAKWPEHAGIGFEAVESGESYSSFQARLLAAIARAEGHTFGASSGLEIGECLSRSPQWRAATRDFLLLHTLGRIPGATDRDREKRESAAKEAGSTFRGSWTHPSLLMNLAEKCVRRPRDHLGNRGLLERTFSVTSSDVPDILVDAANVALQAAFEAQPKNWLTLGRVRPAADFKDLNSVKAGSVNLAETPEGTPVAAVAPPDTRTTFRIKTFTAELGVSRQAYLSDGLGAFISVAEQYGEAANRLIGDTVFNLLTSAAGVGPTMAEDSLALFATTHTSGANLIAAVGQPDAAGIAALSLLMRKQKGMVRPGDTAPTMALTPRYLLAPAALAAQAQITLASLASPEREDGEDPAIVTAPKLLVEPRLDAATNGATAWYLVSTDCEGLQLAFLNGVARPTITQPSGDPRGFFANVVLDFGCAFVEHRGWARTRGA